MRKSGVAAPKDVVQLGAMRPRTWCSLEQCAQGRGAAWSNAPKDVVQLGAMRQRTWCSLEQCAQGRVAAWSNRRAQHPVRATLASPQRAMAQLEAHGLESSAGGWVRISKEAPHKGVVQIGQVRTGGMTAKGPGGRHKRWRSAGNSRYNCWMRLIEGTGWARAHATAKILRHGWELGRNVSTAQDACAQNPSNKVQCGMVNAVPRPFVCGGICHKIRVGVAPESWDAGQVGGMRQVAGAEAPTPVSLLMRHKSLLMGHKSLLVRHKLMLMGHTSLCVVSWCASFMFAGCARDGRAYILINFL